MRAAREQPRIAVARAVVALALIGAGFLIGSVMAGGDHGLARAEQQQTVLARHAAAAEAQLRTTDERLTGATAALHHIRSRLSAAERANRQLERELRDARRRSRSTHRKH